MKKFIPLIILIFLISIIAISTHNLNQTEALRQNSQSLESSIHFSKVNIPLSDFSLPDLFDKEKVFSKKQLNEDYVIINLFASWCSTCLAEHEILMRLKSEKIAKIYGVAWRDIDERTQNFLKENGNPYDIVASDSRGIFSEIMGVSAIPETLIVDKKGIVVMRYRGNLQEFSVDEIKTFISGKNLVD